MIHQLIDFIKTPFSYIVPYNRFPTETHVYDKNAKLIKVINDAPLLEELPKGFMDKLVPGIKESVEIEEQRDFVSESAEMMMRDLVVMQNKIEDLLDSMQEEISRPAMEEYDIEPWIVSKVTKSRDYIDTIYDWILMDTNDD